MTKLNSLSLKIWLVFLSLTVCFLIKFCCQLQKTTAFCLDFDSSFENRQMSHSCVSFKGLNNQTTLRNTRITNSKYKLFWNWQKLQLQTSTSNKNAQSFCLQFYRFKITHCLIHRSYFTSNEVNLTYPQFSNQLKGNSFYGQHLPCLYFHKKVAQTSHKRHTNVTYNIKTSPYMNLIYLSNKTIWTTRTTSNTFLTRLQF